MQANIENGVVHNQTNQHNQQFSVAAICLIKQDITLSSSVVWTPTHLFLSDARQTHENLVKKSDQLF